jgi:hypothetical protein
VNKGLCCRAIFEFTILSFLAPSNPQVMVVSQALASALRYGGLRPGAKSVAWRALASQHTSRHSFTSDPAHRGFRVVAFREEVAAAAKAATHSSVPSLDTSSSHFSTAAVAASLQTPIPYENLTVGAVSCIQYNYPPNQKSKPTVRVKLLLRTTYITPPRHMPYYCRRAKGNLSRGVSGSAHSSWGGFLIKGRFQNRCGRIRCWSSCILL